MGMPKIGGQAAKPSHFAAINGISQNDSRNSCPNCVSSAQNIFYSIDTGERVIESSRCAPDDNEMGLKDQTLGIELGDFDAP
jgi:hypothetical protein